jgi:Translation elongation factors (GTPases)
LLEAVVVPVVADEKQRLKLALEQLSEQDPLIGFRQDASSGRLSVSIYGEVQKEVLEATLGREYGVAVTFEETTPICVERPLREGWAIEVFNTPTNPHHATIGFRVEPLPDDSGIEVSVEVPHTDAPLYVYKRYELFALAIDEYVRESLQHGPNGWRVTDCRVTMTDSGYTLADGPPSKRGPMPTAADIHKLTPIVLAQALSSAGTAVCEPMVHATVDVPPRRSARCSPRSAGSTRRSSPPSCGTARDRSGDPPGGAHERAAASAAGAHLGRGCVRDGVRRLPARHGSR